MASCFKCPPTSPYMHSDTRPTHTHTQSSEAHERMSDWATPFLLPLPLTPSSVPLGGVEFRSALKTCPVPNISLAPWRRQCKSMASLIGQWSRARTSTTVSRRCCPWLFFFCLVVLILCLFEDAEEEWRRRGEGRGLGLRLPPRTY